MKMPCEIIKDLLPLYFDGVCSNDSKAAIDEHLADCDNCRAELRAGQSSLPVTGVTQNLKEAEAVMNLSKRWEKGMTRSLLTGILFAVLTIAAFALIVYVFADVKITF
ncbi:MAG: zf-HC2 domain-containing protein [Oscillospiraceae bacterium]|nr:zf-HC2 domain-containing protein [Oscillospiraceae bacterium]